MACVIEPEGLSTTTQVQPQVQAPSDKTGEGSRREMAQAARDLDLHINILREWVSGHGTDLGGAFPGHGQMQPEQLEIERLRRENAKLKAERDTLKTVAPIHLLSTTSSDGLDIALKFIARRPGAWRVS